MSTPLKTTTLALLTGSLFVASTSAPAQAAVVQHLKTEGKALTAFFSREIASCPARDGSGDTWKGHVYVQLVYDHLSRKQSGEVTYDDVHMSVDVINPCLPNDGYFVFRASGCTTWGSAEMCWTDPVYSSRSVTIDKNLQSGKLVATIPLYGDSNSCGYSAEVTLDFAHTDDKKIKFNDTWHYYGVETAGGPLLRMSGKYSGTVQPANATGSIKLSGWKNLDGTPNMVTMMDGTVTNDPCGVMPYIPANLATGNVVFENWDTARQSPYTAIKDIYDTDFRTVVNHPLPRGAK
jgi:hypothetical protein